MIQLQEMTGDESWPAMDLLLYKWRDTISAIQNTHYDAADHFFSLHRRLSNAVIIITAVVGSGTLASIGDVLPAEYKTPLKIVFGLGSLLAAVLSTLEKSSNYREAQEKAKLHHDGGVEFGNLLRRIDQVQGLEYGKRGDAVEFMDSVRAEWDALNGKLPQPPNRIFKKSKASLLGQSVEERAIQARKRQLETQRQFNDLK